MTPALWIAKTGLEAQQTRMSVITNNLANVNTSGFKRDRAVFEDLMYQTVRQPGAQSSQNSQLPSGLMIGTGVRTVATEKLHTQGNIVQTGNALDLAVSGRGMFQVTMPDGTTAYTRDGSFQVDAQGQLVTANGYLVQPGITIPQGALSVTVGADGTVNITLQGQAQPQQVGQLQLASFVNPAGLDPLGQNLYAETGASGTPNAGAPGSDGLGSLQQGFVEGSNVNVVEELVTMIATQRAYELNSKAIQTSDQMLQRLGQL